MDTCAVDGTDYYVKGFQDVLYLRTNVRKRHVILAELDKPGKGAERTSHAGWLWRAELRDASPEETARSKLLPETQTDFANLTIPSDAHKTPQTTASPKQYKLREHAERTDPELVKPKAPRKLSHESKQTHIVRKLRRARGLWTMQTSQ